MIMPTIKALQKKIESLELQLKVEREARQKCNETITKMCGDQRNEYARTFRHESRMNRRLDKAESELLTARVLLVLLFEASQHLIGEIPQELWNALYADVQVGRERLNLFRGPGSTYSPYKLLETISNNIKRITKELEENARSESISVSR